MIAGWDFYIDSIITPVKVANPPTVGHSRKSAGSRTQSQISRFYFAIGPAGKRSARRSRLPVKPKNQISEIDMITIPARVTQSACSPRHYYPAQYGSEDGNDEFPEVSSETFTSGLFSSTYHFEKVKADMNANHASTNQYSIGKSGLAGTSSTKNDIRNIIVPPVSREKELSTSGFMFFPFFDTSTLLVAVDMLAKKIITTPATSPGSPM